MAAYRADIEVGVKGARQLQDLRDKVDKLTIAIDKVNSQEFFGTKTVASIRNYSAALRDAQSNLEETRLRLDATGKATGNYAEAIRQYVTALGSANGAQALTNQLIADEIELRRKQKLAVSGVTERSDQYAGPIGPGPASAVGTLAGQSSPVGERVQRILKAKQEELELQQGLLRLEQRSARELNEKVQAQQELVKGTQAVYDLIDKTARRQRFLAGGPAPGGTSQGPLQPQRAVAFPVALPETQKERILRRMLRTRQQLKGLADNIRQIDKNAAGAIAEARQQQQLLAADKERALEAAKETLKVTEKQLRISKEGALLAGRFSPIRGDVNTPGSPAFLEAQAQERAAAARARSQRIGSAASSGLIGAGFPLLFGQGPGAALGGGLGGVAGGLLGGAGGFALSIVGTAIGQALTEAEKFNTELAVLNSRTRKLGAESITTARDVEQLAKGLGVAKEEAMKVLAAYSGFDNAKVRNALAVLYGDDNATFAALAAAKDQASLAQVIFSTYNKIGVERADQLLDQLKSGDLAAVELAFQQALLEVEMEKTKERLRQVTIQDRIIAGLASIGAVQGGGDVIDPSIFGEERVKQFEAENKPSEIFTRAFEGLKKLRGLTTKVEGFQPTKRTPGQGALESSERRTAAIKANSQALFMSAVLQDRITAAERIGAKEQALALTRRRDQVKLIGEYDAKIAKVKETENSAEEIAALRQERNVKLVAQQLDYENKLVALRMQQQAAGIQVSSQLQNEVHLLEETLAGRGKEAAIQQEISDKIVATGALNDFERAKDIADQVRRKAALTEQLVEARKLEAVYADIASTLSQGMTQALKDVVKGTQSLRDAAMSMLNNVLNKIIDIAMNMAMFGVASGTGTGGGLLGGLFNLGKTVPGKASGGSVMGGSPYIVGERGPELFVPGRSGTIVPNNSMGGGSTNVVVNVSASGGNVEGDQQGAKQLGQAVAAAVQQELIRQKRPGGLLA